MYDHRFWGPRGPYGAPLADDCRHDWYYRGSDIPCTARVPWEGCPFPPDVCHDPRYAYPPPLPVMGPVPPEHHECDATASPAGDCGCDASASPVGGCTNGDAENSVDNEEKVSSVTYTLTKTGNTITLVGSDGSKSSVADGVGDSTGYTDDYVDTNTTYTLTRSGNNIVLTGSDGNSYTVQDKDTTYEAGSITEAMLADAVKNKLNNTTGTGGATETVTYTIERTDDYIRLKGSDGSESNFRDVILSTWIGQKQIFWVHLADSLKQYIMGQGVYTYVDGQTFDTNHTPLIALNKANERTNLKVYTPGAYDSEMGIAFYEAQTGVSGWNVDEDDFDNRPIVEAKTVSGKKYYKIRLYAGYTSKDNSAGSADILLNLGWLPEGEKMDTHTTTTENPTYTWTYHTIPQANKGLFSVKALIKKEYMSINGKDSNVIDIEFCETDVTPCVWHINEFNDGDLTAIPENAFTDIGTTYLGVNLDTILTTVYRQNLSIVYVSVEKKNGD